MASISVYAVIRSQPESIMLNLEIHNLAGVTKRKLYQKIPIDMGIIRQNGRQHTVRGLT